jgi:hypothetical protein
MMLGIAGDVLTGGAGAGEQDVRKIRRREK